MGAAEQVVDGGRVLARHGLVTAFGHVSVREGDDMVITPPVPLRVAAAADCRRVPLGATALPAGVPAEAWLHLAVYRARPDVGAVCRAQPDDATSLAAAGVRIGPVTGHAVLAGAPVPVSGPAVLVRDAATAERAVAALGAGDALVLRGNGAVTTADALGRAVARMWLLARVARSVALAASAGTPRDLSDEEIASWRAVSGELLDRVRAYLDLPDDPSTARERPT
ncbi:class II aldolase/adducin family protein [Pseudonocardia broussonetiae]|uniref:Class II aldolase/adducin family protein n=1 Tax=Pseudonocardia broussonetiae TaxID=2736640 RepID=A0A6M6JI86_9PSEU|nr:class II aldolase/adducin family protein [Pseudonocardia broussonetiae]QJY47738.1 class II aldolase/adducin family protein [Pseudonocardia broussonetiae]